MTDHHYVLLFEKRVVGISRVTEKVVWEEMIPLVSLYAARTPPIPSTDSCEATSQQAEEHVVGLAADQVNRTYWTYTDQAIYEITPRDEDRDVWRGELEKGNYIQALAFAKVKRIDERSSGL